MTCYLKKMLMCTAVKLYNENKKFQPLLLVIALMCTHLGKIYCSIMPNESEMISPDCDLLYKKIDLDISKDEHSTFDRICQ